LFSFFREKKMRKFNVYLAGICTVLALVGCAPKTEQFSGEKLATQVGVKEGGVIKANGQPGFLVFGPYAPLEPGVYRLVAKGNLKGPNESLGWVDVAVNKGGLVLANKPIVMSQEAAGNIVSLDFEVSQPVADAEFRINVAAQTTGIFSSYELTKVAELPGK
jgi:hypothetical protein